MSIDETYAREHGITPNDGWNQAEHDAAAGLYYVHPGYYVGMTALGIVVNPDIPDQPQVGWVTVTDPGDVATGMLGIGEVLPQTEQAVGDPAGLSKIARMFAICLLAEVSTKLLPIKRMKDTSSEN